MFSLCLCISLALNFKGIVIQNIMDGKLSYISNNQLCYLTTLLQLYHDDISLWKAALHQIFISTYFKLQFEAQ